MKRQIRYFVFFRGFGGMQREIRVGNLEVIAAIAATRLGVKTEVVAFGTSHRRTGSLSEVTEELRTLAISNC